MTVFFVISTMKFSFLLSMGYHSTVGVAYIYMQILKNTEHTTFLHDTFL